MTQTEPRLVASQRAVPAPRQLSHEHVASSRQSWVAQFQHSYRVLPRGERRRLALLGVITVCQAALLMVSLVPQTVWAQFGVASAPIPPALVPLTAALFYVLPTLAGALTRRWTAAVIIATLPAWLDLGLFAILAAPRYGPFYLVQEPHAASTAGTLELFAALGILGWLVVSALREGIRLSAPGT